MGRFTDYYRAKGSYTRIAKPGDKAEGREEGTDELTNHYKSMTPGQEEMEVEEAVVDKSADKKPHMVKGPDGKPMVKMVATKAGKDETEFKNDQMKEGLETRISGGKVPVGQHTLHYKTDKSHKYISNSIKSRDPDAKISGKDGHTIVHATAQAHSSVIKSLRDFRTSGVVHDTHASNMKEETMEEGYEKITPGVKNMAQRVHNDMKAGKKGQGLDDAHASLVKYHGKDWRKRLGVKDQPSNKVKLRGFGPEKSKGNMSNPAARSALRAEEVEVEEAVGTAAKYADKKGMFGGKYSHHDKAVTMKGTKFSKWREKQAAKRSDAHKAQDPKMAKAGYAQNIVDTDKAQKKAAKKGLGKQNISWQQKNSVKRGKLPEQVEIDEKTLTPAEMKKREEIAKGIEKSNPDMPMDKKMAIATAKAKEVAEAKATYCGRCGTTHVPPSEGGTCPALQNEAMSPAQKNKRLDMIRKAHTAHLKKQAAADKRAMRDAKRGMSGDKVLGKRPVDEENIDEISRDTLSSYKSKASAQAGSMTTDPKTKEKRYSGVARASKKLDKKNRDMATAPFSNPQERGTRKDKYGNEVKNRARHLARKGMGESVEVASFRSYISEAKVDVNAIVKELEAYAKKSGGVDKKDFMKLAADMKRTGKLPAKKDVMGMDTDPREFVLGLIYDHSDSATLQKMYGVKM